MVVLISALVSWIGLNVGVVAPAAAEPECLARHATIRPVQLKAIPLYPEVFLVGQRQDWQEASVTRQCGITMTISSAKPTG